jgi:hypothetical protein
MREIEDQAAADDDTSEERMSFYRSEIDKARTDASSVISIPLNREMFLGESEDHSAVSFAKIQGKFARKISDKTKASFVEFMDEAKEQFVRAGSMSERRKILMERDMRIAQMVESGVMTAEDAAETKIQSFQRMMGAVVDRDIMETPDEALIQLQKGDEGAYAGIDAQARTEKIKDVMGVIDRKSREQERASVVAQGRKEGELLTQLISEPETISREKVVEMVRSGEIRPRFAKSMTDAMDSRIEKFKREQESLEKQANTEDERNILKMAAHGALTSAYVREQIDADKISPRLGMSLIRSLE